VKNKNTRILLIEDNPGDARLVREALAETAAVRFDLVTEIDLASGLVALASQHIDAILLDLSLPDTTGFETFTKLHEKAPQVPIILLTGADDDAQAAQAVRMGAQDYLVKGQVEGHEITRAIRYAIERKRLEERLQFLATHDDLTGLPNRRLFQDRMAHAIEHSRRFQKETQKKWGLAVALLDLDSFKSVNDTLGHAQGDCLLQAVADRLQRSIRKSDTLARMGGDEFTMIYEDVAGRQDAEVLARKIQAVFSSPFQLGDNPRDITASIGISLYPSDGEDAETLLRQADIAMYRAKCQRNTIWFYEMCKEESSR
jgi:diguanylate cyclase (GGDEF)-like protein